MNSPTLSDEQVASMRSSVMHAVDADISRRGRRTRQTLGLAAASVVVIGFGSLGINALSNVSTSSSDSAGISSSDSSSAGRNELQSEAAAGDEGAIEDQSVPDEDREVITTGEITVTVKDPRTVAQKLSAYVEGIGGRVDSRTENGSGDDASAYVTVRVPSSKVTATIDRLDTYGKVDNISLQNDDVTAQAKDLDARIDALQLSIDRLERILADADTSGELIKAETALTKRQSQLESLQAQRKGIADQVSLSTLSIDISQTTRAESVEPGGFTGGLKDGWNALVSTVNNIVEVAGALLPWVAPLIVLYALFRLVFRRGGWN